MEKYSKYECDIELSLEPNNGVFCDLGKECLKVSESMKIVDLNISKKKVTGKMVIDKPPSNIRFFVNEISMLLEAIGIKINKSGEHFFQENGKITNTKLFRVSFQIKSNKQKNINLEKIITQKLVKRINDEKEEYELICQMLNINKLMFEEGSKTLLLYLPISLKQLMDFIFEVDKTLKVDSKLSDKEKNEAIELMKAANEFFKDETGFRIGDMLNKGINKEDKTFIFNKNRDIKAYEVIKELCLEGNDAKIFILIHALRNISSHFSDLEGPEKNLNDIPLKVRKFKQFLIKYGRVYNEILKRLAFKWLGIEDGFEN